MLFIDEYLNTLEKGLYIIFNSIVNKPSTLVTIQIAAFSYGQGIWCGVFYLATGFIGTIAAHRPITSR